MNKIHVIGQVSGSERKKNHKSYVRRINIFSQEKKHTSECYSKHREDFKWWHKGHDLSEKSEIVYGAQSLWHLGGSEYVGRK